MPHVSESRVQPDHDGHDRLLVAALAAGDLAGTDRDHALQLIRSCSACADLHDDLIAISRATAVVPPPVAPRPRDFQLSPADAARLRPAGWRRLIATLGTARLAASRPLGVGLATFGLVGLLLGNAPVLSIGGSASSPAYAIPSAGGANDAAAGAAPQPSLRELTAAPIPVASAAASAPAGGVALGSLGAAPSASDDGRAAAELDASSVPEAQGGTVTGSTGGSKSNQEAVGAGGRPNVSTPSAESGNPLRSFNLAFALLIVLGLVVLAAGTIQSRRPA